MKKTCLSHLKNYLAITLLTVVIVFVSDHRLVAQNLVANPSFEENDGCPEFYTPMDKSHNLVPGWCYPTKATPDYFNRCSKGGLVGVPKNFAGVSEPKTGNAYIGLIAVGTNVNNREYIQGTLTGQMNRGEKYCVSMSYKLASFSRYAVDQIGIFFSETDIRKNEILENIITPIGVKPQVSNPQGTILDNTDQWKEMCQVYTATGLEAYVVIGNFRLYKDTKVVEVQRAASNALGKEYSYYYLDDVAIIPLKGNCQLCSCVPHDLDANHTTDYRSITIAATGGVEPYTYEWSTGDSTKTAVFQESGTYTYIVTDANGCQVTKQVVFVAPPVTLTVTHTAGYTGGSDGWIDVTVRGGKPPYRYRWSNDSITEDLSNQPEGEYTYLVTDSRGDTGTGTVVFKDQFKQELEQIEEGGKIALKNIFFDNDKTTLKPQSYIELEKLFEFMQEQNIGSVEISGHTDSNASDLHNQKLSDGRARSVVDYLISRGIDKERLASIGYGESQPIANNTTEDGRAQNRRVEFKILKK